MMSARGFLIAAEEDFGITSVEAQACGTPVVALARGGSLETVRDLDTPAPSGTFFHQQTPDAVAAAIRTLETHEDRFDREGMRAATMRFSPEAFRKNFSSVVNSALRHARP
jgi:glycosyltransferase involved in cell wall biosynthesis